MFANKQGYSQADERSFRIFTDQHGREWGADIEKKTNCPCGPLAPQFTAPLNVPQKYLAVIDPIRGKIEVQYERWVQDQLRALDQYELSLLEVATRLFGDKGLTAIRDRDPQLLRWLNAKPEPIERIEAARQGNRWVLGLDPNKPAWAEEFFPTKTEQSGRRFLNADEEQGSSETEEKATARAGKGKGPKGAAKTAPHAPAEAGAHESWRA